MGQALFGLPSQVQPNVQSRRVQGVGDDEFSVVFILGVVEVVGDFALGIEFEFGPGSPY